MCGQAFQYLYYIIASCIINYTFIVKISKMSKTSKCIKKTTKLEEWHSLLDGSSRWLLPAAIPFTKQGKCNSHTLIVIQMCIIIYTCMTSYSMCSIPSSEILKQNKSSTPIHQEQYEVDPCISDIRWVYFPVDGYVLYKLSHKEEFILLPQHHWQSSLSMSTYSLLLSTITKPSSHFCTSTSSRCKRKTAWLVTWRLSFLFTEKNKF